MSRCLRCLHPLLIPLLLLAACAIQPIQPEAAAPVAAAPAEAAAPAPRVLTDEEAAALAVMRDFAAVTASHPMTPETLDDFLAFYADDSSMQALPSSGLAVKGKQQLRIYFLAHDAKETLTWELTPLDVSGSAVTVRNHSYGSWTAGLPAGTIDGTEVFVIGNGQIVQDTWLPDPDSLVAMYDYFSKVGVGQRVTEMPTGYDAVAAAFAPWGSDGTAADAVETTLAAYADNAILEIYGWPGGPRRLEGKEALRAAVAEWAAAGATFEFEPVVKQGLILAGRTTLRSDALTASGIESIEATDCFKVLKGQIVQEWRAFSPASIDQMLAAAGQSLPE